MLPNFRFADYHDLASSNYIDRLVQTDSCEDFKIADLKQTCSHAMYTFLLMCFLIACQLKLFRVQTVKLPTVEILYLTKFPVVFLVFSLEFSVNYLVVNASKHRCGDSIFHQA